MAMKQSVAQRLYLMQVAALCDSGNKLTRTGPDYTHQKEIVWTQIR
jgi:hypothetical protein